MSRDFPLPIWLLALDLLATVVLVAGLMLRFAPDLAAGLGLDLPVAVAWPLIILGALGMVACGAALVRHLQSRHSSRART